MSETVETSGAVVGRRRLWLILGLIVALLGLGISLYSTMHHIEVKASGKTDAACNINASFSCDDVALSAYSEVMGIPLGVLGLGYFAALTLLLGIGLAQTKTWREHLQAYTLLVGAGVLTSIVLALISALKIGSLCPTCMGVYALTLIQAGLAFAFRKEVPSSFNFKEVFSGLTTALVAVALVVAGYSYLAPSTTKTGSMNHAATAMKSDLPTLSPKVEDIPVAKTAYAGLGEDYRKGGDQAKVVIQEFADFECPACSQMSKTLQELQKEFGDKVLVVFRNYPLDNACNSAIRSKMHQFSCKAAVMARCGGQYGKFWPLHDLIFQNQRELSEDNLKKWSRQVGLNDEQINTCWNSADILNKIKDDIALGNKMGIDSTPTVFINGQKAVGGLGVNELRSKIEELLN